jgi:hypothetical protein
LLSSIETNEDRLHSSVFSIVVQTFELHKTKRVAVANICILTWVWLTSVKIWWQPCVVWDYLEVFAMVQDRPFAVLGVNEWKQNIQRTRAWESSAIFQVSPLRVWFSDVSHGVWCDVIQCSSPE